MQIAPRNAIEIDTFSISTFIFDNWIGFKITNIPIQPIIKAIITFRVSFSLINMPANIDIKIGYVYWMTVDILEAYF